MLFASTSLAARIERAEARLVSDSARAAQARRPGAGAFVMELAGGVATFAGPGSPLNKVAGLGFGGALDVGELEAVEEAYAERGTPVQVELSCLASPEIAALLTRRGYVLVNFENVLGRRLPPETAATPAGISVSECPEDDLSSWLDVAITGFASPDLEGVPSHESFPRKALEETMADMAQAQGFVRYLARREAPWPEPEACGSSRASRSCAAPRRFPSTAAAASRERCSAHGSRPRLAPAATSPSSRRSPARSRRRTSRSAASSCSTLGRFW